jgi:phosphoheptose isomerase
MSNIFETDPGTNNKLPFEDGVFSSNTYSTLIIGAISEIKEEKINLCTDKIQETFDNHNQIIFAGNGGSHAIAMHMACDYGKGLKRHLKDKVMVSSLGSNNALSSAIANDFGYENLFSAELEMIAKPGDLLIAISSSGNSPNILNAIKKSKEMSIFTIGLSGFDGGSLREESNISIHINLNNYPGVEFLHQYCLDLICMSLFKES